MIQTEIRNNRGELEKLEPGDARYWDGPYKYTPYPKALYRQTQPGAPCEQREVQSETEQVRLGPEWFESPADAKTRFEALEAEIAKVAAERHYTDRRMSDLAQAEALAADRATDEMVADVPRRSHHKKTDS